MTARLSPKILAALGRAVSTGDPVPARAHHRALLAASNPPVDLLFRLAMLEARSGEHAAALRLLEAARTAAPENPDLLVNLAQLRLGAGDPQGALACLEALPAPARAHPMVARLACEALSRTGRYAEAAEAYETGLRRAPDDAVLHANLGTAYRALGRLRDAARHLETALQR